MCLSDELSPSRNMVLPIFCTPNLKLRHQPSSFLNSLCPFSLEQFGTRNFSHDLPKAILVVWVIKFVFPLFFMRGEGAEDKRSHPLNRVIPVWMTFFCFGSSIHSVALPKPAASSHPIQKLVPHSCERQEPRFTVVQAEGRTGKWDAYEGILWLIACN